jgi:hypothetical protein
MGSDKTVERRPGVVSVWVGTFPSVEAAEAYFGIPDEIGVYLPPEGFAADLGVADLPAEHLEVDFEQLSPRPLRELLERATFSASFLDRAAEAASRQGIVAAQGIALVYHFDYQSQPGWKCVAGPMTFVGSFPFEQPSPVETTDAVRDPRIVVHDITDTVL